MAVPASVRLVLDEDLPSDLADHLRARGFDCVAIEELRESVWGGMRRVTDELVCEEIARVPSVLVTMNVRDYADQAFLQQVVEEHGVGVVIVRVPKRESGRDVRPRAVRDIVHRNAPRISSASTRESPRSRAPAGADSASDCCLTSGKAAPSQRRE